jgi:hypothetical protein
MSARRASYQPVEPGEITLPTRVVRGKREAAGERRRHDGVAT